MHATLVRTAQWRPFALSALMWLTFVAVTTYACLEFFRLTSMVSMLCLYAAMVTRRLHRRRWITALTATAFLAAMAVPVDIYWSIMHGPLVHRTGSSPRFVRAVYGLTVTKDVEGEAVLCGCSVTLHDTRWCLVLR